MVETRSDISSVPVLRQEKFLQQAVHLQQAFAVQAYGVAFDEEKTPVLQRLQRRGEAFDGFDAELLLEIIPAHSAQLELQHKFADETLIIVGRERAVERQFALLHARQVRIEVVMILVMRAVDVPEGSDAQREQIRARPQTVAIDELRARRVFY